ncbi:hypothetical protein [Longitalea luteola]|uniref:hypothetical protein n=1 Tax=Longitalea luteola TaxID=2812563 RepID=UPI001A959806|nr:hypothetical protein [Longitalea luteola]
MEIKPKKGIGEFTFGMKADQVVAKLGKPDKTYQDEDDENQLLYQYNKHKLRLTFYQDHDGKLGYIRSANPNLTFQGKPVMNTPIDKVKSEVFGKFIEEWEEEDYDFFVTYVNEDNWIVLNVEYDEVTEIELGVPVKNDDEYDW